MVAISNQWSGSNAGLRMSNSLGQQPRFPPLAARYQDGNDDANRAPQDDTEHAVDLLHAGIIPRLVRTRKANRSKHGPSHGATNDGRTLSRDGRTLTLGETNRSPRESDKRVGRGRNHAEFDRVARQPLDVSGPSPFSGGVSGSEPDLLRRSLRVCRSYGQHY